MSDRCEIKSDRRSELDSNQATIFLQGVVDENTDLTPIEESLGLTLVDLSGVSRINAAGQLRLLRLRLRARGQIRFLAPLGGSALIFSEMLTGQH